ncbi:MAG: CTP synthase, partial [Planctomycetes bacterium]|nr:CTP synthase [Planctomycetota bacterium]
RHRYEVDPQYIDRLEAAGLVFSGRAPDHPIMQVLELPESVHPFFIGTQAHPEFLSRPLRPEPMFAGFIKAAKKRMTSAIRAQSPGAPGTGQRSSQ